LRAAFPRALSVLLLAFIVCGTTVEAAHNHSNLVESVSLSSAAHFSDPATESKLDNSSLNCSDCLICQLHQHFSATVISVPPSIAPLTLTASFTQSSVIGARSQTIVTRTGRAPPQISC